MVHRVARSDFIECPSGVPQGSNLDPYFFILYVIDIREYLGNPQYLLYADDFKIFREIRNQLNMQRMQKDLDGLVMWSDKNAMPLNVKKFAYITLAREKIQFRQSITYRERNYNQSMKRRTLG